MVTSINVRLPPKVEKKLVDYCAKREVTRSEAIARALDQYLDAASGGASAWSLAVDLIPEKGTAAIQSENARELARKAFRGPHIR